MKPTGAELIGCVRKQLSASTADPNMRDYYPSHTLANRAELVLAMRHAARAGEGAIDEVWGHGWNACLENVFRLLDGVEFAEDGNRDMSE